MPYHTIIRIALLGLALALATGLSAETGFSSLEERMTGQEFRETGLHKLSDEELAALNRWIQQRSLAEGEAWRGDPALRHDDGIVDRRGLRDDDDGRSAIKSRIDGPFTGWRGNTEFKLENGMVWRQAEPGLFSVNEMENPEVEIRPGMFGVWRLRVAGYNTRVRVERIR